MGRSPGHRKWPEHKVEEQQIDARMTAETHGEIVAESTDVLKVREDEHPDRFYFPRADVRMESLEPSGRSSKCPFKGTARYFSIRVDGDVVPDAAWTYEDPYEEHLALKGRIAFHDERGIDLGGSS